MIVSFCAGFFYTRFFDDNVNEMHRRIKTLEVELASSKDRNEDLRDTLQLVKRQIQTDRLAYESLQKTVIENEKQNEKMQAQLEKQRKRLSRLSKQQN